MINEIIYWELYALVVSFFNGVLLAWIYDNIRAFRRIVRHKTVVFMSVEGSILHYYNLQRHDSMYLFLIPLMYFLFCYLMDQSKTGLMSSF